MLRKNRLGSFLGLSYGRNVYSHTLGMKNPLVNNRIAVYLLIFQTSCMSGWAQIRANPAEDVTVGIEVPQPITGYELLEKGDYANALSLFQQAAEQEPDNPYPYYYSGTANNRLKQYDKALHLLRKAEDLDMEQRRRLDFEYGWSYLKLEKFEEAEESLRAFLTTHPNDAQAIEFLGRTLMEMGRYEEAEQHLAEAKTLNPNLTITSLLYLMETNRRQGDIIAAATYLNSILVDVPTSPITDSIRDTLGLYSPTEYALQRKWRATAVVSAGYNDNVPELSDEFVTRAGFEDTESSYITLSLAGHYNVMKEEKYGFTLGHSAEFTMHESEFDTFDQTDHYTYLSYYHTLAQHWRFRMRISDQYTWLGESLYGTSFRNKWTFRPSLSWQLAGDLILEGSYLYTLSDYYILGDSPLDRNGEMHSVNVTAYYKIPNTSARLRGGLLYGEQDTKGSDYDLQRSLGYFTLSLPLVASVQGDLSYYYSLDDYKNPNTFGEGAKRKDDVNIGSLQFTRPIAKTRYIFLRGDMIESDSNISLFSFSQTKVSLGLILQL